MKPRVTGRARSVYAMDKYTVEMRPDGLKVRKLHCRTEYEVPFDHILELVASWIKEDAADKLAGRKAKVAGLRRAARDKDQLPLPLFTDAHLHAAT